MAPVVAASTRPTPRARKSIALYSYINGNNNNINIIWYASIDGR
jgi:hypothetical protein